MFASSWVGTITSFCPFAWQYWPARETASYSLSFPILTVWPMRTLYVPGPDSCTCPGSVVDVVAQPASPGTRARSKRVVSLAGSSQLLIRRPVGRGYHDPDELKLEAKHTIDMRQFVDEEEIDSRYWERPGLSSALLATTRLGVPRRSPVSSA